MGKTATTIQINSHEFRKMLNGQYVSFADLAKKYGVTRQAVNGWLNTGRIPPRVLANIALDFKIPPEMIKEILKKESKISSITIEIKLDFEQQEPSRE